MDIGVFGASGVLGRTIIDEAVSRGHRVTAFTRSASRIPTETRGVAWRIGSPLDGEDAVATHIDGLDVVVNAINAGDDADIPAMVAGADSLPAAARTLLKALERRPATRLLVLGGAGSLELRPGLVVMDAPGFADSIPRILNRPREYMKVIEAHREALDIYRLSNRNWTYISPSAREILPGERTGRFRVGGDQVLTAADGSTSISAEDFAIAVLDEIELPQHVQRRFTVGY